MMLEAAKVPTNVGTQVGRALEVPDGLVYGLGPCDIGRRGDSVGQFQRAEVKRSGDARIEKDR